MLRLALVPATVIAASALAAPPAPPAPPGPPSTATAPSAPLPLQGDPAYPEAARGQAEAWRRWGEEFRNEMHASLGTMFVSRIGSTAIVKGAPYSAEVITERNQHLEGGNMITHATHGHVYRDGDGRVRQETEGRDGKPGTVFIDDAVVGERYMLLPGRKHALAIRDPAHVRPGSHRSESISIDGTEVKVEDGKAFVNGKPVDAGKVHVKSASGKEIRIENGRIYVDGRAAGGGAQGGQNVTVVSRAGDDGLTREVVRVEAIRSDDDMPLAPPAPPAPPIPPLPPSAPGEVEAPIAPLPPMPGVSTLRFESTARLGRGATTTPREQAVRRRAGRRPLHRVDDPRGADRQSQAHRDHVRVVVRARPAGHGVLALRRPAHRGIDLSPGEDPPRGARARPLQDAGREMSRAGGPAGIDAARRHRA